MILLLFPVSSLVIKTFIKSVNKSLPVHLWRQLTWFANKTFRFYVIYQRVQFSKRKENPICKFTEYFTNLPVPVTQTVSIFQLLSIKFHIIVTCPFNPQAPTGLWHRSNNARPCEKSMTSSSVPWIINTGGYLRDFVNAVGKEKGRSQQIKYEKGTIKQTFLCYIR